MTTGERNSPPAAIAVVLGLCFLAVVGVPYAQSYIGGAVTNPTGPLVLVGVVLAFLFMVAASSIFRSVWSEAALVWKATAWISISFAAWLGLLVAIMQRSAEVWSMVSFPATLLLLLPYYLLHESRMFKRRKCSHCGTLFRILTKEPPACQGPPNRGCSRGRAWLCPQCAAVPGRCKSCQKVAEFVEQIESGACDLPRGPAQPGRKSLDHSEPLCQVDWTPGEADDPLLKCPNCGSIAHRDCFQDDGTYCFFEDCLLSDEPIKGTVEPIASPTGFPSLASQSLQVQQPTPTPISTPSPAPDPSPTAEQPKRRRRAKIISGPKNPKQR